jgi:hypothetical protein
VGKGFIKKQYQTVCPSILKDRTLHIVGTGMVPYVIYESGKLTGVDSDLIDILKEKIGFYASFQWTNSYSGNIGQVGTMVNNTRSYYQNPWFFCRY